MLEIEIRPAEEKDYKETENIARQAFYRDDRIAEIGVGCTEPYMLHMLRKEVGIKELDFVAYVDGKAVGQIIYSHSHIRRPDGSLVDTLNFGPLSVLPEFQKMGVGSALMRYSMKRAKELGYGAIYSLATRSTIRVSGLCRPVSMALRLNGRQTRRHLWLLN